MADNDSNIIKPVESLHNIAGLTPTKRREQRKRRQNLHEPDKQEPESAKREPNGPVDEQDFSEPNENENDRNTIDYCAWPETATIQKREKG